MTLNINPAYLTFSKHSIERMAERNIQPYQIRNCVAKGISIPANSGCKAFVNTVEGYTKKALKVVLNEANKVVTTCWQRMPKELKKVIK